MGTGGTDDIQKILSDFSKGDSKGNPKGDSRGRDKKWKADTAFSEFCVGKPGQSAGCSLMGSGRKGSRKMKNGKFRRDRRREREK